MNFRIRWPDGTQVECYSPSTIIEQYLSVGQSYSVPDFLTRAEQALEQASERVRERYGYACSSALDQLAELRAQGEPWTGSDSESLRVEVLSLERHAPRDARESSR